MNKEEYLSKQKELDNRIKLERFNLMKEYAYSNNLVKIGDIIKDHSTIIEVDKIQMSRFLDHEVPVLEYYGKKIKKDGKFFKDNSREGIHQSNLKEINGKELLK